MTTQKQNRSQMGKLTEWRDELSSRVFIAFEKKKDNVAEQIKSIIKNSSRELTVNPPASQSKGRVLFFSPRWWSTHSVLESTMAYALRFAGYSPEFLACGKGMNYCDLYRPGDEPGRKCAYCKNKQNEYFTNAGLPISSFPNYVKIGEVRVRAEKLVANLTLEECRKFELDSVPLGWLTELSVVRSLRSQRMDNLPHAIDSFRSYLKESIVTKAVAEIVLRQNWKFIVVLNGLFYSEAVFFHMARSKGIDVITYERGFEKNTLLFARNAIANHMKINRIFQQRKDTPLSSEQEIEVDRVINVRRTGKMGVIAYYPDLQENRLAIFSEWGIDAGKPITLASPNILWDTAVVRREIAFNGLWDWLKTTIEFFAAKPDQQLIVRLHPAEVRLPIKSIERLQDKITEAFPKLPPNVVVIPSDSPASSYVLIDIAERVLVYTSTVGLEAALHGKEVVTVADTHYRGNGYTTDVNSRDEYLEVLHRKPVKLTPERMALARRYTHIFFFRFHAPFNSVYEDKLAHPTLAYSSLDELKSGKYPEIRFVADKFPTGEDGVFLFYD